MRDNVTVLEGAVPRDGPVGPRLQKPNSQKLRAPPLLTILRHPIYWGETPE